MPRALGIVWLITACGTPAAITPEPEPSPRPAPRATVQSPPASCNDAARIALGAARLEGVEASLLADCDVTAVRCSESIVAREPVEPPDRCTIDVTVGSDRYEVHITPTARDGAPIEVEAWVDAHTGGPAERTDIPATRWAVSADRAIAIAGVPRQVSHTHGGDPARIGHATFRIANRLDVPVPLAATRVEWLTLGGVNDIAPYSITPIELPPRSTTEVDVMFDAQAAYLASHERFASRVTFDAGGRSMNATVDHLVIRREPLR